MGADLRREPAGDLGHRGQQRQRAVGQLDGLVGDRGDAGVDQRIGALARGGQVQVGEQRLPGSHPVVLLGDGLLDLQDQLTGGPHLVGGVQDGGAGALELLVGDRGAEARVPLDVDLMAVQAQLVDARRRDRDPELVVLDLAGDADLHLCRPLLTTGSEHALAGTPVTINGARWPPTTDSSLLPGRKCQNRSNSRRIRDGSVETTLNRFGNRNPELGQFALLRLTRVLAGIPGRPSGPWPGRS